MRPWLARETRPRSAWRTLGALASFLLGAAFATWLLMAVASVFISLVAGCGALPPLAAPPATDGGLEQRDAEPASAPVQAPAPAPAPSCTRFTFPAGARCPAQTWEYCGDDATCLSGCNPLVDCSRD